MSSLSDADLLAELRDCEQRSRAAYARELRVLAEIEGRNLAPGMGYADTAALAREALRINPLDARRRMHHTHSLVASYSPTGAALEPELPEVLAAAEAGAIGAEHIEAIRATVAKFPRPLHLADREAAQTILLDAARIHEPAIVARLGREILVRLDQDGTPPDDTDLHRPHRSLDLTEYAGGRVAGSFDLDPETGALLTNLLSPHTAPDTSLGPDPRSKPERQADAFAEILRLAATNEAGPTEAGEPVNLLVTIPLEKLEQELGHGLLEGATGLSAATIRRMACDAGIIPCVLGSTAEPLDIGRKNRSIPRTIRRALIARDKGCAAPGCPTKAKWCAAHHIIHWINHGETKLDNLVLLCHRHHRTIHHTEWQVRITNGHPEFIPPKWLDPDQTPRRNTLHQRE